MQTKGFIKVVTVALILICAFYLSFSFVASHYESQGEMQAIAAANKAGAHLTAPDMSNEVYKKTYNDYMDKLAKQEVYKLGIKNYTFQEVREKQLGLGLDLKGGMNVTLQISVPDILKALANESKDKKFRQAIAHVEADRVAQDDYVESFCQEYKKLGGVNLRGLFRSMQKVQENPNANDEQIKGYLKDEVNSMVDNSYNVLRNRIDKFGVVAPNIQKLQSTGRILLELPGIKEPERVKKLLQGTANLEFYETYKWSEISSAFNSLVAAADNGTAPTQAAAADTAKAKVAPVADSAAKAAPASAKPASTRAKLSQMLQLYGRSDYCVIGVAAVSDTAAINSILSQYASRYLPTDLKLCWTVKADKMLNDKFGLIAIKKGPNGKAQMNGDVVTEAKGEYEQLKGQVVTMKMNNEGARQWSRLTGANINRQVAVVLDDMVYSYPNVNSQIDGGNTEISGNFTVEESNDLANVLESGKMVARVNIASESVIGPSLGQESINKGITSFVIALILLMVMMMLVYGMKAGNIANLGLVLNLFFLFGILASFQSVLTLPGIAGIVLSLGMAVDANVLIFERCKEELRNGKNLKAAIVDGYSNAFSAIFDGNLTSIITGVILAYLGTGPIRGFAITLIIGIICSFFTAVFVTRLVLENFVGKNRFGFASMTFTTNWAKNWMQNTHFNFIDTRKKVTGIVVAVVVLFVAAMVIHPLNMGIDFSGGRNYVVKFDKNVVPSEIQKSLKAQFPENTTLSVITIDNNQKVRVSTNYKVEQNDSTIDNEIMHKLYDGMKSELGAMSYDDFSLSNEQMGVVSQDAVGPSIASDMTRGAIMAVVFSLIAMALYILIRFRDVAFSLAALLAVAMTAFVVIGFYTLHGIVPFSMEVDQTFIAAVLTVIGYQINDTVVVFDRVREYRKLFPKQDEKLRFNNALNSTLSRTMMTSISTLLVLLVMFFLGGESIRAFVFAMIIGVCVGTCGSLFVAAPAAYAFVTRKRK